MIQSFNCFVLRWLKKNRSEILRGQLSENLTRAGKKPHYVFRFFVKYLLTNVFCRPDFISYKSVHAANLSLVDEPVSVFRAPVAVWTLRSEYEVWRAKRKFQMYIFERNG